ncbi:MAG: hypothetical protein IPK82_12900 [Polyangiaceae bacterium]|nr:hypothetical protein [Polyangiaceae bacterium]
MRSQLPHVPAPLVGVFVPSSEIFPGIHTDFSSFRSLVGQLSRTDTLFWCSRLNLILSNSFNTDELGKQEYLLHLFLDGAEIERINRFTVGHGGTSQVRVFMRAQLLELMRWTALLATDSADDGTTFEDPVVRHVFAQALFLAGEIWSKRTYSNRISTTGNLRADRRRATPAFRQSISQNEVSIDLAAALARGFSIYRDFNRHGYRTAEEDFVAAAGMTIDEYLACVCGLLAQAIHITPDTAAADPGIFHLQRLGKNLAPGMSTVLDQYLTLESQTADELRTALWGSNVDMNKVSEFDHFDVTPLRERPILRAHDGRAVIADPVYFSEKSSVGPLFMLAKSLRGDKRANTLFGAFGRAFESYVVDLLRSMYPASAPPLADRLITNVLAVGPQGDIELADACLLDVNTVILFEVKGAFVREDALSDGTLDAYFTALCKKYGTTPGNKSDRGVKGAAQLARSIRLLATDHLRRVDQSIRLAQCVYPVLVVHDCLLGTPGHADFFAEEFAQALEPESSLRSGYMQKGRLLVAPLTVMTVEDLEILQSSVENFALVPLLCDYCNTYSNGVRSGLHDFMGAHQEKYRIIHSKELADRAMLSLQQAQRMMFPDEAPLT